MHTQPRAPTPPPRPQAAPRVLYMRAFAHLFESRPAGPSPAGALRAAPEWAAARQAINEALAGDFAAAREAARCGGLGVAVGGMRGLACALSARCAAARRRATRQAAARQGPFRPCCPPPSPSALEEYRKVWEFGQAWDGDAYAAQPRGLAEVRAPAWAANAVRAHLVARPHPRLHAALKPRPLRVSDDPPPRCGATS